MSALCTALFAFCHLIERLKLQADWEQGPGTRECESKTTPLLINAPICNALHCVPSSLPRIYMVVSHPDDTLYCFKNSFHLFLIHIIVETQRAPTHCRNTFCGPWTLDAISSTSSGKSKILIGSL